MSSVTIVTGSSQGIGAATARLLAQQGHRLLIHCAHHTDLADIVAAQCLAMGAPQVATVQADLCNEAGVMALFHEADRLLPPITGLVNNAGIVDHAAPLQAMSAERLMRMMAVNVVGPMLCAREAIRRFNAQDRAGTDRVIVNVSSSAARSGGANMYVDYAASKGAIDTFTQGLAKEVAGQGIRVCGVRPGITHTSIHAHSGDAERATKLGPSLPMGRAAAPEEVAHAITWLLSPQASYTSGAILDVAGAR